MNDDAAASGVYSLSLSRLVAVAGRLPRHGWGCTEV